MCEAKSSRILVYSLAYDVDDSQSYLLREDPLNLKSCSNFKSGCVFQHSSGLFLLILSLQLSLDSQDLYIYRD